MNNAQSGGLNQGKLKAAHCGLAVDLSNALQEQQAHMPAKRCGGACWSMQAERGAEL